MKTKNEIMGLLGLCIYAGVIILWGFNGLTVLNTIFMWIIVLRMKQTDKELNVIADIIGIVIGEKKT